jgi:hypothetical protein
MPVLGGLHHRYALCGGAPFHSSSVIPSFCGEQRPEASWPLADVVAVVDGALAESFACMVHDAVGADDVDSRFDTYWMRATLPGVRATSALAIGLTAVGCTTSNIGAPAPVVSPDGPGGSSVACVGPSDCPMQSGLQVYYCNRNELL